MTQPVTLAQISDTHLLADKSALLRGRNPWLSLSAVLQQAIAAQPDGLLLSGDLAERGELAAYENVRTAIFAAQRQGDRPVKDGVTDTALDLPIYWLPGNHDDLAAMKSAFQSPCFRGLQAINLGTWQLILLDSVLPQAQVGEGRLSSAALDWLHLELCQHPDKPTIVALHHHPVPVSIDWVDQMQVQNADELLAILDVFPQVKLVSFGHIHFEFQHQRQRSNRPSIAFYGCPSTHLQIDATANHRSPGFRLIHLHADGTHQTQVCWLPLEDEQ
ncbi:metallophosphoesterase [cf. Phormidesmis sp. LEGE 11477]|nr:metallophosphoesterase [cf. Phormidesmis sp. LEGE 11477]